MKNSIIIASLVGIGTLMPSCNDFLEVLPKAKAIAKTTSDFRLFMDNADTRYTYNLAQNSVFVDIVSDDAQLDSAAWASFDNQRLHANKLYAFEKEVWSPEGATTDGVWKQLYYISTLVSNFLEEIPRADDNVVIQRQLISEAKVHRAYAYLTLINTYAKHYNPATASSDLGVPILNNPVSLPALNRSSVKAVYDFILSELKASLNDLPEDVSQQFSHRPTKVAALAILARTYLYMGDYENALKYADESLAIRDFLYDYNDIYTGDDIVDNVIGISRANDQEMLLHKTTIKGEQMGSYMTLDTATLNEIYDGYTNISPTESDNHDLRRTLWFDGFDSDGKMIGEFVSYVFNDASSHRYKLDNNGDVDYIPVATPEMYVTRAEANARLGNLQEALDDINTLRQHRFKTGTYTNMTLSDLGNNQTNVIDEVLLERRRELYGKELRLFDVKRLGLSVTHQLGDIEVSVPANDPKLIFPIYYDYIQLNPELEQNPR